jgi:hypothetical protein
VLQQITMARQAGMKISKEEAHERTGWRMISDDEEYLGEEDELMAQYDQLNQPDPNDEMAGLQQGALWYPPSVIRPGVKRKGRRSGKGRSRVERIKLFV